MIYIPVEIYVREASFVIHLVTRLLNCGQSILLGDQRVLQSAVLRDASAGIYFDKSLDSSKSLMYGRLSNNIRLIAHDVEFTGVYRGTKYIEQRFSEEGCKRANLVIFHDNFEANSVKLVRPTLKAFVEQGSWYFESVATTPMRYKLEISMLQKKYGENFIFVPSNFGGFFRREGLRKFNEWICDYYAENDYKIEFKNKIIEREKERLIFAAAIRKVAINNPNRIIVLRPHPTEDEKAWEIFPFPDNVIITTEYTTAIMTAACSAVIHNGCTTVIDANILGCPQYVMKTSPAQDLWPFWQFIDYKIDLEKPFDGFLPVAPECIPSKIPIGNVTLELGSWIRNEIGRSNQSTTLLKILFFAWAKGIQLTDTFKYSIKDNSELVQRIRREIPHRTIFNLNRCLFIK
jgi:surface carbohydrate biosynthesis protein